MVVPAIRTLLLAALLALPSAAANVATRNSTSAGVPTQHNEATVAQLQAEMASGKLTSEQLTSEYIARIVALDQNGPGVNAVIELNPLIIVTLQVLVERGRAVVAPADFLETIEVGAVPGVINAPPFVFEYESPVAAVVIPQHARAPMPAWGQDELPIRVLETFPPFEFDDAAEAQTAGQVTHSPGHDR